MAVGKYVCQFFLVHHAFKAGAHDLVAATWKLNIL